MGRAGVLQEIRRMRFEVLLERHERGELSQVEAAEWTAELTAAAKRRGYSHAGQPAHPLH